MIIREISVRDFAILQGPLAVRFGPGINVIHGPNETGKSTLLRAIEYALTMRARMAGAALEDVLPRGGGAPEVELAFERAGHLYRIAKSYRRSAGRTRLLVRDAAGRVVEDLSGDAAEERLAEVVGFGAGTSLTRGKRSREESLGFWPLIYVRQGRSLAAPSEDLNERSRRSLAERLAECGGDVLAGNGAEALLDAVRSEYARYFTEKGREATKEGSPLARLREKLKLAEGQLADLENAEREHRRILEEHDRARAELERLEAELPRRQEDRDRALAERERVRALSARLDGLRKGRDLAASQRQAASDALARRRKLRRELEAMEAALAAARSRCSEAAAALEIHDQARPPLEAAEKRAVAEERTSAETLGRLRRHREVVRDRARREALAGRLEKARREEAAMRSLDDELAKLPSPPLDVEHLEALEKARDIAAARLDAAAAGLRLRALGDSVAIDVAGERLELRRGEAREVHAAAPLTLRIADLVEIDVTPGGAELVELSRSAESARRELADALAAAGVRALGEAREVEGARLGCRRGMERHRDLLESHAPDGMAALEAELGAVDERLQASNDALSGAGEVVWPRDEAAIDELLRGEEASHERAVQALDAARAALAGHDQELERLRSDERVAAEAVRAASERLEGLRRDLDESAGRDGDDAALEEASRGVEAQALEAETALAGAERELEALRPAEVEHEAEATGEAYEKARTELEEKRQLARELAGRLAASDILGLHEKLAEAAGRVEALEEELQAEEEHAYAVKLLRDTILECQEAARRSFLEPLEREVQPFLDRLFPSARLGFEAEFGIRELTREERGRDTFGELSAGAKEQFGLIVRLALAKVLAGGEPLPVLLDDSLVSTDDDRFERVAAVLELAASSLQVIVATCHWDRYRRLGIDPEQAIDLAELAGGARARLTRPVPP